MPREEQLAETLRELSQRQAVRLVHERFGADADGLAIALQKIVVPRRNNSVTSTGLTRPLEDISRQSPRPASPSQIVTGVTGTVKWYNHSKGFGFIKPDGAEAKDVFVHVGDVERSGLATLSEGQRLRFDIVTVDNKTRAANLVLM
jgi:cold shock protein